jgi:hypothetical protein
MRHSEGRHRPLDIGLAEGRAYILFAGVKQVIRGRNMKYRDRKL